MSRSSLVLIFCLFFCSRLYAEEAFPPAGFTKMSSETSPRGTYEISHYKKDPDDYSSDSQIWIKSLKPGVKDRLIYTHNNCSSWLLSGDDRYIALDHHELSGLGTLHVFSLDENGRFEKIKKDYLEEAKKLVKKRYKLQAADLRFDHEYCYSDCWLRDGLIPLILRVIYPANLA